MASELTGIVKVKVGDEWLPIRTVVGATGPTGPEGAFDDTALHYLIPDAVTLTPDETGTATLALADRAVVNATANATFETLAVEFPESIPGRAREFDLCVTVAAGVTAPAISYPDGVTVYGTTGSAPKISNGKEDAQSITLIRYTEIAPGVFKANIEMDTNPDTIDVDELVGSNTSSEVRSRINAIIAYLRNLKAVVVAAALIPLAICAAEETPAVQPVVLPMDDIAWDTPVVMTNTQAFVESKIAGVESKMANLGADLESMIVAATNALAEVAHTGDVNSLTNAPQFEIRMNVDGDGKTRYRIFSTR